jgi:hypothetical protein
MSVILARKSASLEQSLTTASCAATGEGDTRIKQEIAAKAAKTERIRRQFMAVALVRDTFRCSGRTDACLNALRIDDMEFSAGRKRFYHEAG